MASPHHIGSRQGRREGEYHGRSPVPFLNVPDTDFRLWHTVNVHLCQKLGLPRMEAQNHNLSDVWERQFSQQMFNEGVEALVGHLALPQSHAPHGEMLVQASDKWLLPGQFIEVAREITSAIFATRGPEQTLG